MNLELSRNIWTPYRTTSEKVHNNQWNYAKPSDFSIMTNEHLHVTRNWKNLMMARWWIGPYVHPKGWKPANDNVLCRRMDKRQRSKGQERNMLYAKGLTEVRKTLWYEQDTIYDCRKDEHMTPVWNFSGALVARGIYGRNVRVIMIITPMLKPSMSDSVRTTKKPFWTINIRKSGATSGGGGKSAGHSYIQDLFQYLREHRDKNLRVMLSF